MSLSAAAGGSKAIFAVAEMADPLGLADGGLVEDSICKKCGQLKPPQEEQSVDDNYLWVQCDQCTLWVHAVCVLEKLKLQGIEYLSQEALDGIESFICCEE